MSLIIVITILLLPLLLLFVLLLLLQLVLPQTVRLVLVQIREDKVKDVAVPLDWLALDTLTDILIVMLACLHDSLEGKKGAYLRQLKPITHIRVREDNHLRPSSSGCNSLLSQSANTEHTAGNSKLTSHSDCRV